MKSKIRRYRKLIGCMLAIMMFNLYITSNICNAQENSIREQLLNSYPVISHYCDNSTSNVSDVIGPKLHITNLSSTSRNFIVDEPIVEPIVTTKVSTTATTTTTITTTTTTSTSTTTTSTTTETTIVTSVESIPLETTTENIVEDIVEETVPVQTWTGAVLTPGLGSIPGPSGKETYYNLNMSGVISLMQDAGYNYEYWVRDDGVKMYGDYVMCAANLDIRPRGTIIETSLGLGMVCDTGIFAEYNIYQVDIAVTW